MFLSFMLCLLINKSRKVHAELPKVYTPAKLMCKAQPFEIKKVSGDEQSGYKAPWDTAQATIALQSEGVYECSGNVLWCRTGMPCNGLPPREELSLETLYNCCQKWFSKDSANQLFTKANDGATQDKRRLFSPTILEIGVMEANFKVSDHYNGTLDVLGGQAAIEAWYLAMYFALSDQDQSLLSLLWSCGLSVTIQVKVFRTNAALLQASSLFSEKLKDIDEAMTDSFFGFVIKVKAMGVESVKQGSDLKLKFAGAKYSNNLHQAFTKVAHFLQYDEVMKEFRRIDISFGRTVLSNHYSKLKHVLQIVQKESPQNEAAATVFTLQLLWSELKRKAILPAKVSVDWLDKDSKGKPGFVRRSLVTHEVISGWLLYLCMRIHTKSKNDDYDNKQ